MKILDVAGSRGTGLGSISDRGLDWVSDGVALGGTSTLVMVDGQLVRGRTEAGTLAH